MNNRKKSFIFFLSALLFLSAWSTADLYLMKRNLFYLSSHIKEGTKILILGDSHTQTSLDPSLIDASASFSFSNESPFFTYCKAKYIIDRNPDIKTVIVGFSYNNISDVQEKIIRTIPLFLDNSFILMDSAERDAVKKISFDMYAYYVSKYIAGIPFNFYKNNYLMMSLPGQRGKYAEKAWGGYKKMSGANLPKQIETLVEGKGKTDYSLSPFLVEYIDKLAKYCEENGVRMFIMNTPMHDIFFEKYSERLVSEYDSVVSVLLEENENLIYLDFRRFSQDTSIFYDGEHLNDKGAADFSAYIDTLLKELEDAL